MEMLSKFYHMPRQAKYHYSEYSTYIILQCIQDLKTEVSA